MIPITKEFLETPLAVLVDYGLDLKIVNLFEEERDWIFVEDIADVTPLELLMIPLIADETLRQVQEALKKLYRNTVGWID